MPKFKKLFFISLLTLGIILLTFLLWVAYSEQKLTVYDLNSYKPFGYKAISLLSHQSGFRTTVIKRFDPKKDHTLILFTATKLSREQKKLILNWVSSGGIVFELAQSQLQLDQSSNSTQLPLTDITAATAVSSVAWLKNFHYNIKANSITAVSNPELGIYGLGDKYFIFKQNLGQGQIITWTDPEGITNRHLKQYPGNAVIFLSIIKAFSKTTILDFYDLRYSTGKTNNFSSVPLLINRYWAAFFLFLLGTILFVWKLAARFGRPRPLVLIQGRSSHEFILSMAGLFQLANARGIVLDNLWLSLLKEIELITGLATNSPPELLIARLSEITGKDYTEILQLGPRVPLLSSTKAARQDFLELASKLDNFRKELRQWKKSALNSLQ